MTQREDRGRHLEELVDSTTENRTTRSRIPDGTNSYWTVSSADTTNGGDDDRTRSTGVSDEDPDIDFAKMMRNICYATRSSAPSLPSPVPSSPSIDDIRKPLGVIDECTCTQTGRQ